MMKIMTGAVRIKPSRRAVNAAGQLAIEESVSLPVFATRLRNATDDKVREVVARIHRDEAWMIKIIIPVGTGKMAQKRKKIAVGSAGETGTKKRIDIEVCFGARSKLAFRKL